MKGFTFRRRLAIWSTLLAVVVLLVSGAVAAFFVYRRALAQLDEEMRGESSHFFSELRRHGMAKFDWKTIDRELHEWMPPEDPPRLMEIRTGDGILRYRSKGLGAPGFEGQASGFRNVSLEGKRGRLLIATEEGVTFAVASGLQETEALVLDVVRALAMALPFALALAWLGGKWLAARAVEPVEQITAAAESVNAEHLDQRVPVPPVADEIQRLATVLNTTLDRLQTSYAQAVRFSADASHELKTPLTVLRTSIEALMNSSALCSQDHQAIAGLLDQTQRLSRIIASLLLLSRADARQLTLDAEEHDLVVLTAACAEDARIMAEERGVSVECHLPPTAPAMVDAMRFAQIVSNLLDNAVKYNRLGGLVRVTLEAAGGVWQLRVGNTGHGVAPEFHARLFERFFRAEHSAEENGQGLGLSLARELAHAHGGEIVLITSNSHWTEFLLTLPMAGPESLEPRPPVAKKLSPHIRTNRTMKTSVRLIATFLATALISPICRAEEAAKIKGLARIPAAASAALVKYAADNGMKIEEVSTEKHGKVTVYEATLTAAGKPNHEVAVTADGKVKGEEETVPLESVPEAARKAIVDGAKGAKISRVQKIKEDGLLTYEALYVTDKGKKTEVEYLEDGKPKPEEK